MFTPQLQNNVYSIATTSTDQSLTYVNISNDSWISFQYLINTFTSIHIHRGRTHSISTLKHISTHFNNLKPTFYANGCLGYSLHKPLKSLAKNCLVSTAHSSIDSLFCYYTICTKLCVLFQKRGKTDSMAGISLFFSIKVTQGRIK